MCWGRARRLPDGWWGSGICLTRLSLQLCVGIRWALSFLVALTVAIIVLGPTVPIVLVRPRVGLMRLVAFFLVIIICSFTASDVFRGRLGGRGCFCGGFAALWLLLVCRG